MNLRRRQQPAVRTDTPERSLDPSLQNRANAQHRRIQQLIGEASHYEVEAANLRLDLKQADATIAYQAKRIEALELIVRRRAPDPEPSRPPLTAVPDADPTGALPLATGGPITGPAAVVGEAGCDLYMSPGGSLWPHGAWVPRSSADTQTITEESR
jgi:hypothetical protein